MAPLGRLNENQSQEPHRGEFAQRHQTRMQTSFASAFRRRAHKKPALRGPNKTGTIAGHPFPSRGLNAHVYTQLREQFRFFLLKVGDAYRASYQQADSHWATRK